MKPTVPIITSVRLPLPGSMRASGGRAKAGERKLRKQRCFDEAAIMLAGWKGKVSDQVDHELRVEVHMPLRNDKGYRLKVDPHNHMPALIDAVAKGLGIDDKAFLHTVCEGVHDKDEHAMVSVGKII